MHPVNNSIVSEWRPRESIAQSEWTEALVPRLSALCNNPGATRRSGATSNWRSRSRARCCCTSALTVADLVAVRPALEFMNLATMAFVRRRTVALLVLVPCYATPNTLSVGMHGLNHGNRCYTIVGEHQKQKYVGSLLPSRTRLEQQEALRLSLSG